MFIKQRSSAIRFVFQHAVPNRAGIQTGHPQSKLMFSNYTITNHESDATCRTIEGSYWNDADASLSDDARPRLCAVIARIMALIYIN